MDTFVPGAVNVAADELTPDMLVPLATPGPRSAQTTLENLAQFFASEDSGNVVNTNITTAGAGALTAAALTGGLITRSGPTGAYTDTTATAAQLLAALGADTPVGSSRLVYIKNTVAFTATLAAGSGVTLAGQTKLPPNSVGIFLLSYDAATPAFTLRGIEVGPLTTSALIASTALTTVGAGTVTGAGVAGGLTTRSGAQSNTAFTDTTDTADNIIAAMPNANIGQSFIWRYRNNTDATATIAGGSGVTVSGIATAPPNTTVEFLVTYTAASTMTAVGISRTVPSTTSGTVTANGVTPVAVANTIVTANSAIILTLKTVHTAALGIFVSSVTPGTGFSITGQATDVSDYNYLILN